MNYSKELEKVMLEDNIYIVRLSIPSIDMVEKCFSDELVDDLYNENLLNNDVLLVRTGESVDYVREILTNKKIPILYSKSIDPNYILMRGLFPKYLDNTLFKIEISNLKPYFIKAYQNNSKIINFNEKCNIKTFDEKLLEEIKEYYKEIHSDVEKYSEELDNIFSFCNNNFFRICYEYNLREVLNFQKEEFNSINKKEIEVKDTYKKIKSTCECDKCKGKSVLYRNTGEPVEEWKNPYVERSNLLDTQIKNLIFNREYITCDKCAGTGIQYCYDISELHLQELYENKDSSKKEKSIIKKIFKVK